MGNIKYINYFLLYLVALSPLFIFSRAAISIFNPTLVFLPLLLNFNWSKIKEKYKVLNIITAITILTIAIYLISSPSSKGASYSLSLLMLFLSLYSSIFIKSHFSRRKIKLHNLLIFTISLVSLFRIYFYIKTLPIAGNNMYYSRQIFENKYDIHGTYLGLIISTGYITAWYKLLFRKNTKIVSILYIVAILINTLGLYFAFSRNITFSACFVTLLFILIYFYQTPKAYLYKTVLILFIIIGGFFLTKKIYNTSIASNISKDIYSKVVGADKAPRHVIYSSALELYNNSKAITRTPELLQIELNDIYKTKQVEGENIYGYNTHNQYLNYLLLGNLLLLIPFLLNLLYCFFHGIRTQNYLYTIFIFMLAISCLTENILSRQFGIYIWIVINLFFFTKIKYTEKD